jgi:hypothetical protein
MEGEPPESNLNRLERTVGLALASEHTQAWWRDLAEKWPEEQRVSALTKLALLVPLWRQLRTPCIPFLDGMQRASRQSGARQWGAWVAFYRYQLLSRQEEEQLGLPPEQER